MPRGGHACRIRVIQVDWWSKFNLIVSFKLLILEKSSKIIHHRLLIILIIREQQVK